MAANKVPQDLTPLDLIFSCAVCQDTVTEIYAEAQEDNSGLRVDPETDRGIVVKLWLTECAHLTCGKHLEGGGAPFHSAAQPPRAPCPVCVAEAGITEPRNLYAVYGTKEGQHDPIIPRNYFDTPPIRLDGTAPGMDALRFQYLSLVRYGSRILRKLRHVEHDKLNLQVEKDRVTRNSEIMKEKLSRLEGNVRELEEKEEKLKYWEEREPAIRHYLHVLNPLAKENEMLKQQLSYLGYAVPTTKYAMDLANKDNILKCSAHTDTLGMNHATTDGNADVFTERAQLGPTVSIKSPLVRDRRSPNLEGQAREEQQGRSSSGRKRKLDDSFGAVADADKKLLERSDRRSRERMPPPPRAGPTASLSPNKLLSRGIVPFSGTYNDQSRSSQKPILQSQEAQRRFDGSSNEEPGVVHVNPSFPLLGGRTNNTPHVDNEASQCTTRVSEGSGSNTRQSTQQLNWQHLERPYRDIGPPFWSRSQSGPNRSSQSTEFTNDIQTSPLRWSRYGASDSTVHDPYTAHEVRGDHVRPLGQVDIRQQDNAHESASAQSPGPHRISLPPPPVAAVGHHGSPSHLASYTQMTHSNSALPQRGDMGPPSSMPYREALKPWAPNRNLRTPVHEVYPLRSRLSTESARNNLSYPTTPLRGGFAFSAKNEGQSELRRESTRESVSSPFFKSHVQRSGDRIESNSGVRGRTAQNTNQGWRKGPTASNTSTTLPSLNGLSFITDPRAPPNEQFSTSKPVTNGNGSRHFVAPSTPRPNAYHRFGNSSTLFAQPNGPAYQYPRTFSPSRFDRTNIFSRQVQPLPSAVPSIASSLAASQPSRSVFARDYALPGASRGGGGGLGAQDDQRKSLQQRGSGSTYSHNFQHRVEDNQHHPGSGDLLLGSGKRSVRR